MSEQKTLIDLLEAEKEKAKETISKAVEEYYNKTGLIITKIDVTNANMFGGAMFTNITLFTSQ